MFYGGVEKK